MDFGFFAGLPYDNCNENFDNYRNFKNRISKNAVIAHITSCEYGLTSLVSKDVFTGEKIQAGMFWDGNFVFPYEFLHYYENYDIGIPYEYEAYLKSIGIS